MTRRQPFPLVPFCQSPHCVGLTFYAVWTPRWLSNNLRQERLRLPLRDSLGSELLQGADQLRTPFPVFPPQEIPSLASFVENYTSSFVPCCPFHCSILSAGRTDSDWNVSTVDSRRAASKSLCRKRQTRRWVPDSANAFTLPCRTQSNSVRTLTFRCCAASTAVNHSAVATAPTWLDVVFMDLWEIRDSGLVSGLSLDLSCANPSPRKPAKRQFRSWRKLQAA